jgi:hypothetical protein
METYYDVFVRTWWRLNPSWPDGLEPCPGKKRYIARHVTREDALGVCEQYNSTHEPGRLSKKAEFEEA